MKIRFFKHLSVFVVVFVSGCVVKPQASNPTAFGPRPKNVIILIADGAGFNHFKSVDYYQCGNANCQPYENFPVHLAVSTCSAGGHYDANTAWTNFNYFKKGATDSAAAATAMATGIKSYNAAIGVDIKHNPVPNLTEQAEKLNKSTGVVTSVPFTHATPAGFVAHNDSRNNYAQISDEMINKSAVEVIMGCGNPLYNDDGMPALLSNFKYIDEDVWSDLNSGNAGGDADGDGIPDKWTFIQTRAGFQALVTGPTPKRVCGIPQVFETLQQNRSGNAKASPFEVALTQAVPTLKEMTLAALNVLDEDPDGFFIMIEGGATDWASHNNRSGRLVEEMNDFNCSVKAVIDWVNRESNWNETLVVITADHETGYLTGPDSGQKSDGPVWKDLVNKGPANLPQMQWHSDSHTNSLVPFFAKGPGSKLFETRIAGKDPVRGPYIDNTSIAKVIFSLWSSD